MQKVNRETFLRYGRRLKYHPHIIPKKININSQDAKENQWNLEY